MNIDDQENPSDMLLKQFLKMADDSDPDAGFYLAELFLGELPTDNVDIYIAVAEVLIKQSIQLGSKDAKEYMSGTWSEMREPFIRRLTRRGLKGKA